MTLLEETQEFDRDRGDPDRARGGGPRPRLGVGSGVVIAPGQVLANALTLRDEEVTVTFADGRRAAARVAGADADLDVAVLEVDTGRHRAGPVGFEPRTQPGIGRPVLALGNPGGRGLRVTPGFVSSVARSFAVRAAAASAARSSTPPRCLEAPRVVRWSTSRVGCSG